MQKWIIGVLLLLLVSYAVYGFVFSYIVPNVAALTVPQKWKRVPLRQKKEVVHNYLGENFTEGPGMEVWAYGSKGKMYRLFIFYSSDTVSIAYSIHYAYDKLMVTKDYLVDSFYIK